LENAVRNKFFDKKSKLYSCKRHLSKLIYKLKLNAWNTKVSQNVVCVCSKQISVNPLFFWVPGFITTLRRKKCENKKKINFDIVSIFDSDVIVEVVKVISNSPVYNFS
jgi:hypothetical protein